jgi:hypothetical protein
MLHYELPLQVFSHRRDRLARDLRHCRRNQVISNHPSYAERAFIKLPKAYQPELRTWINPKLRKLLQKMRRDKIHYTATIKKRWEIDGSEFGWYRNEGDTTSAEYTPLTGLRRRYITITA